MTRPAALAGPPPDTCAWFARQYGREPEGAWFAPGRVNLIGGPDYNEVFVLPFALRSGVCAAASRRPDGLIAVVSMKDTTPLAFAERSESCVLIRSSSN